MSVNKGDLNKKYTYKDYLTWSEKERWEIIEGIPYAMTPAPSTEHQRILRKLFFQFENYFKDKLCEVFIAPFDVRLTLENQKDEEIDTVVQPDIVIICDKSKLDEKGYKGSPDIIVEILSPATAKKDMVQKLNLYEKVGVKEYWIVHPTDKTAIVFKANENNLYGRPKTYSEEDVVSIDDFSDLIIDLKAVF